MINQLNSLCPILLPVQLDVFSGSVEQVKEPVHDLVFSDALQLHKQL